MSEEKKNLSDEELSKVVGGGSGSIPKEGVLYESYTEIKEGYYYSQSPGSIYVVYVYRSWEGLVYLHEYLTVDTENGVWSTRSSDQPYGYVGSDFMTSYKYRLNVRP